MTTYYIDAERGDDAATGLSPHMAWRSCERASKAKLEPGDRLLFAGGQTFQGSLHLRAATSGSQGKSIQISSFGRGRATIDAGTGDGIVLDGCAFVTVSDLKLIGVGRKRGSDGSGIDVRGTKGVAISRVEVEGFRQNGILTGGDVDTCISHVVAHDNGSAGICVSGDRDGLPRSRNVTISWCRADNNPGDPKNLTNHSGNGIIVGGLDGGIIEYCEASNNGWDMPRKGNGPVGIWGWDCDRLTIEHCISHDNKSPGEDGDGFDFDGGVTNSVLQYNLSYGNVGTGYLLCQYPGAKPWKNNVVRYNVSMGDGSKNFQSGIGLWIGGGDFSDAQVYCNTIVNPWHAINTYGDVPGMVYRDNIFVSSGDLLVGPFTRSRFDHNVYWHTGDGLFYHDDAIRYATLEAWAKATGQEMSGGALGGLYADPQMTLPSSLDALPTDPTKLASMPYFKPKKECAYAGAWARRRAPEPPHKPQ